MDATMTGSMTIVPQADLGAAYRAQKGEIDAAIARVLASGKLVLGNEVAAFEKEFANWLGAPHAVGCASGTDALALLLRGLGIGPASSVVTVSHTSVATVAAVEMCGAVPILIDVERDHYTMDATDLEAVLSTPPRGTPPIRAAIVVHLYGQPAGMARLIDLCAKHHVALIEDCSQAHGARYQGRRVGTLTEAAAFSLYPTKNLGGFGDGGVMATRDAALCERIIALRQYGWRSRYISDEVGMNSRLDEIQAAVLRVRLSRLDAGNARRRLIAEAYDQALAGSSISPARAQAGDGARLPPVRHSHGQPGRGTVSLQCARRCDRGALSRAGPSSARLLGPGSAGTIGLPQQRLDGWADTQPANLSRDERRAGGIRLRRSSGRVNSPRPFWPLFPSGLCG